MLKMVFEAKKNILRVMVSPKVARLRLAKTRQGKMEKLAKFGAVWRNFRQLSSGEFWRQLAVKWDTCQQTFS
jgi:hypothetical protein